MTIYTLSGQERATRKALFERLFTLRHDVFVKTRNWTLPTRAKMEFDEYDVPEAQYFFGVDDTDTIVSHVRLTPTTTHSLMADYFPHLVEPVHTPRGAATYEATRYIVPPNTRSVSAYKKAKAELLLAMLEWCRDNGVAHVQAVIDAGAFNHYLEASPETEPLGLSSPYGGGPLVPGGGEAIAVRCPVTANERRRSAPACGERGIVMRDGGEV